MDGNFEWVANAAETVNKSERVNSRVLVGIRKRIKKVKIIE